MKKILLCLLITTVAFISCNKNADKKAVAEIITQNQLQSTAQINNFIQEKLNSENIFTWDMASDNMLWSAIIHSGDHIVSVGYKPFDEQDVENHLGKININEARWLSARQKLLQIIFEQEKKIRPNLTIEQLEVWKEKVLPVMDVTIENFATIQLLRKSKLIRYVEPMGYEPSKFENKLASSGSGCGGYTGDASLQEGNQYNTVAPNAKVSWNFGFHGIQNAWAKSTGAGITLMVIDSGVSPDQANLGSEFNQGYSSGRTITKIFTLPGATDANDVCGHGTAMSGEAAAPRCADGNACGVAYNCNFVICKAAYDVLIDDSREIKAISDAYTLAANNSQIKVISMSMGRVTAASQIADAIKYAYSKDKLMFCAGGTSVGITAGFWGVIFPAWMPEVNAVTGVKDRNNLVACNDCHKGAEIDFVVVMEKAGQGTHAVTTATNNTDQPTIVGGSSVATATAAGIAVLVWSKYPTFTRDQVLNKLTITSSAYPNKTAQFGWGKLNADAATN